MHANTRNPSGARVLTRAPAQMQGRGALFIAFLDPSRNCLLMPQRVGPLQLYVHLKPRAYTPICVSPGRLARLQNPAPQPTGRALSLDGRLEEANSWGKGKTYSGLRACDGETQKNVHPPRRDDQRGATRVYAGENRRGRDEVVRPLLRCPERPREKRASSAVSSPPHWPA